jgi:lysozyme family protein
MEDMPLGAAREIYRRQYWDGCSLSVVAYHAGLAAERLFDVAVNMGQGMAGKMLQRCLNVLNRGAKDYQDIAVDGIIGAVTIEALKAYMRKRGETGEEVLVAMLAALQGARYVELAENDRKQEDFVFGWIRQRILGQL